jgi:hypothetical protein
MTIATIVDNDRRDIDFVVVFRYELDVGRKLDRFRRFERLIEFPKCPSENILNPLNRL